MNYGICIVSVAAVRAEASDRAEMVTQLLFGEKVEVTETTTKWLKIKNKYDDYEGWIDPKMLLKIEEKMLKLHLIAKWLHKIRLEVKRKYKI